MKTTLNTWPVSVTGGRILETTGQAPPYALDPQRDETCPWSSWPGPGSGVNSSLHAVPSHSVFTSCCFLQVLVIVALLFNKEVLTV